MLWDLHISRLILFHFICLFICLLFAIKLKDANYKSNWNILRPMKNHVRFGYVPWRKVCFYFISIAWVHFTHKTEKFRGFLIKEDMASDLNMFCQTVSWIFYQIKICLGFSGLICIFWHYYRHSFKFKKFLTIKKYQKTLLKILYLKCF